MDENPEFSVHLVCVVSSRPAKADWLHVRPGAQARRRCGIDALARGGEGSRQFFAFWQSACSGWPGASSLTKRIRASLLISLWVDYLRMAGCPQTHSHNMLLAGRPGECGDSFCVKVSGRGWSNRDSAPGDVRAQAGRAPAADDRGGGAACRDASRQYQRTARTQWH